MLMMCTRRVCSTTTLSPSQNQATCALKYLARLLPNWISIRRKQFCLGMGVQEMPTFLCWCFLRGEGGRGSNNMVMLAAAPGKEPCTGCRVEEVKSHHISGCRYSQSVTAQLIRHGKDHNCYICLAVQSSYSPAHAQPTTSVEGEDSILVKQRSVFKSSM